MSLIFQQRRLEFIAMDKEARGPGTDYSDPTGESPERSEIPTRLQAAMNIAGELDDSETARRVFEVLTKAD